MKNVSLWRDDPGDKPITSREICKRLAGNGSHMVFD
jgi:hypothetical protein